MKKYIFALCLSVVFAFCGCSTNIAVESSSKIATYDDITGELKGTIDGYSIENVFKATNIALERDLKYFRVGQKQLEDGWKVYARAELDHEIVVVIRQKKVDLVALAVSYDGGNLMKSQEIFNSIARNVRALGRN